MGPPYGAQNSLIVLMQSKIEPVGSFSESEVEKEVEKENRNTPILERLADSRLSIIIMQVPMVTAAKNILKYIWYNWSFPLNE